MTEQTQPNEPMAHLTPVGGFTYVDPREVIALEAVRNNSWEARLLIHLRNGEKLSLSYKHDEVDLAPEQTTTWSDEELQELLNEVREELDKGLQRAERQMMENISLGLPYDTQTVKLSPRDEATLKCTRCQHRKWEHHKQTNTCGGGVGVCTCSGFMAPYYVHVGRDKP